MSNLSSNNKSRMKGDFHVRFCERLAGEIPACLLDLTIKEIIEQLTEFLNADI